MKNITLFLSLFVILLACKGQKNEQSEETTNIDAADTVKYTLTPFSSSQDFPDATLVSMDYKDGKFMTEIGGSTYKLGVQTPDAPQKQCANSAEGQHLHLIVDSEPYVAKYTPSFSHKIPDGEHYILTFLSRSYHESLKTSAAHKAVKAMVKDSTFLSTEAIQGPMLFYSRPKGLYTGDDKRKVMLDFYLVNTDLGGYMVEADINGEKHLIETWQPYYIVGLPDGQNNIKLTLLDKAGNIVAVPLNPVTRTFDLEKTPEVN